MASPWSNTVDRALRTTNETLERLQRAEVSYEQARARVFPGERSPLDKHGVSGRARLDIPPPLPQSRYPTSRAAPTDVSRDGPNNNNNNTSSDERLALGDVLQAQNLLRSQMQTLVAELALERVARTDSITDLRALHLNQVAALTSSLTQLKDENAYLKQSVRALETRQAYQRGLRPSNESGFAGDGSRLPMHSSYIASPDRRLGYTGASGFGEASALNGSALGGADALADAKVNFLNTSSALGELQQRVGDVESGLRTQKERLDNRQDRSEMAVADLVKAQVAMEVERMRSIAREAARDSTEDLIKLRVNAVQSMFNAELQKVLESTGVSQEVASATERQFRRLERDWEARIARLETASQGSAAQIAMIEKLRDETASAQSASAESLRAVQAEVTALKRQAQDEGLRHGQLLTSRIDACRADTLTTVAQLLDDRERQRLTGQPAGLPESEVRRLIESAVAPLHATLQQTTSASQRDRDRSEAAAQELARRVTEAEASQRTQEESSARLQDAVARSDDDRQRLRSSVEALQQTQRSAQSTLHDLGRTTTEATEALATLQSDLERHQQSSADALRAAQKEQAARLAEHQRQSTEAVQSVAAQVEDLADTVAQLQQEHRRLVAPLSAKVDAVKAQLEDACVRPLDAVQATVAALAAQHKQLQESKNYQDKVTAQQLSDIKEELGRRVTESEGSARRYTDHVQDTRTHAHDILLQRVANLEKSVQSSSAIAAAASSSAVPVAGLTSLDDWRELQDRVAQLESSAAKTTAARQAPAEAGSPPPPGKTAPPPPPPPAAAAEPTASAREVESMRQTIDALGARTSKLEEARESSVDALRGMRERLGDAERGLLRADERREEAHRRVEASLQQQRTEWRGQLERQEAFVQEQLAALSSHAEELVKGVSGTTQTGLTRLRESLAPARLTSNFAADEDASAQLAALLEPHLVSVQDVTQKLAVAQAQIKKVEATAAEAAAAAAAFNEQRAVEATPVVRDATGVFAEERDALDARLTLVERNLPALAAAHDAKLLTLTQTVDTERTAVAARTDALESKVHAHGGQLTELAHGHAELSAGQRSVLNTVQERLRALEDTLREAQEAALQPLRVKVGAAADGVAGLHEETEALRAQLSDTGKTCLQRHEQAHQELSQLTAAASADRDELCKRLLDTAQERHAAIEDQLRRAEGRQHEALDKVETATRERLEALEKAASAPAPVPAPSSSSQNETLLPQLSEILDPIDEQLQQLQAQLDAVLARDVPDAAPVSADSSREPQSSPDVADLVARVANVEARLSEMRESEDAGLLVTADALGSLSDSLQQCVEKVKEELQRSDLWSVITTPRAGTEDDTSGSAGTNTSASSPRASIQALDDIFVFLLRQLRQVFHALGALQESAIASLEMIQQQELDVLAVPPLQRAVLDLVRRLEPVARAVNVDPESLHVDVGPLVQTIEDADGVGSDGSEDGVMDEM